MGGRKEGEGGRKEGGTPIHRSLYNLSVGGENTKQLGVDAWTTLITEYQALTEGGRERGREEQQIPPAVDFPQVPLVMIIIGDCSEPLYWCFGNVLGLGI